ncbi:MAG: CotS family spore coat protein [Bacillota bacterium]
MKEALMALSQYNVKHRDISVLQKGVFRIKAKEGDYCLKRTDRRTSKLIFIYSVLKHLVDSGFHQVSVPVLSQEGQPFVTSGRNIYSMTKWVSGVSCDFKRNHHLAAAAGTLAEFHNHAQHLKVLPGGKARVMYYQWPKQFLKRIEDLREYQKICKGKSSLTDFEKRYLKYADYFIDLGEKSYHTLQMSSYSQLAREAERRKTFTHRDIAARNFIIGRDGLAYLIDFDYCRYDLRLTDVVRMIERTLKFFKWSPGKADFILKNYNRVNLLSPEEYTVMLAFFQFPQKFWRISNRYFHKQKRWQEEGYLKKLSSATRKLEQKEAFIKAFEKIYCL